MPTIQEIQNVLRDCLKIVRTFDWLLDSYVLDFYVDDHWNKLPTSWKNQFECLNPEDFFQLLCGSSQDIHIVWPLSLLAIKQLLKDVCISRKVQFVNSLPSSPILMHPKLGNLLNKCVKSKKRHEIQRMAAICLHSIKQTQVDFVIDFGAGLGHLARVLGYGYGIQICCLERQSVLNDQAKIIDAKFEKIAQSQLSPDEISNFRRPIHVTFHISATMSVEDFLQKIGELSQEPINQLTFGIIGLHTCGDLGAVLIRLFLSCKQAKFLNIAGCCYMKLTTAESKGCSSGYPMSTFLQTSSESNLSYESREIACHAIEIYSDRLKDGDYECLKVHSYRAAAEKILINHKPELKHIGLRSVKYEDGMTFENYFWKAVQGLKHNTVVDVSRDKVISTMIQNDLCLWKRIVMFYTMRLLLAPVIETIILYDRMLYLMENRCNVRIDAVFDPKISPRNHITNALKLNSQLLFQAIQPL